MPDHNQKSSGIVPEKKIKKFLTNVNEYDNLNKLFQTAKTKNLDN